jgi:hypothetical protein
MSAYGVDASACDPKLLLWSAWPDGWPGRWSCSSKRLAAHDDGTPQGPGIGCGRHDRARARLVGERRKHGTSNSSGKEEIVHRAASLTRVASLPRGYSMISRSVTDPTDFARTAGRIAAFSPDKSSS